MLPVLIGSLEKKMVDRVIRVAALKGDFTAICNLSLASLFLSLEHLQPFPPHHRAELQGVSSDSASSGPDEPLQMPKSVSMEFTVHVNS